MFDAIPIKESIRKDFIAKNILKGKYLFYFFYAIQIN